MKLRDALIALIFVSGFYSIARSQWTQAQGGTVNCFSSNGTVLYGGYGGQNIASGGVVVSSDNGVTWSDLDSGAIGSCVFTIATQGSTVFAGAGAFDYVYPVTAPDTLWRSTDKGATWTQLKFKSGHDNLISLAFNGTNLFATTAEGLLRSGDSGKSWKVLTDSTYGPLAFAGSKIYSGSGFQGLIVSSDSGASWKTVAMPYGSSSGFIVTKDSFIAALIGAPNWFDLQLDSGTSLAYSTNGGKDWHERFPDPSLSLSAFAFDGKNFYTADFTSVGFELYSEDTGRTWVEMSGGPNFPGDGPAYVAALIVSGNNLVASSGNRGIWYYPLNTLSVNTDQSASILPISLFPNPTPGLITVRGAIGVVMVTNVLGQDVLSANPHAPSPYPLPEGEGITLDLSPLPAGTYFVRVETPSGVAVKSVVKQ